MATILCVDDEPAALLILRSTLDQAGHRCIAVTNVDAALNVLARGPVDLIISDYRMPQATGLEFLERLKELGQDIPLVMATGYGSIEHAVAAIKAGAVDYLTKPIRPEQLTLVVDQALEYTRLRRENEALRKEVRQLKSDRRIIGESPTIERIMRLLHTVAPTRAAVLLEGESGTGKELLARAIHDLSDRSDGPYISLNCAALPEALVESMLFGHERGAFTGAVQQVRGAFERAHRGTLLLDEISEMRLDLQAKLLRVLQEQEFERVGGSTAIRVDVRIVATTNRDLAEEVRQGRFREDLYYRLSVMPIRLPSLRERPEDIPLLAQHFAIRAAREMGKPFTGIDPAALDRLRTYPWPGNVRELAHAVERGVIMTQGTVLGEDAFDLPRLELMTHKSFTKVAASANGADPNAVMITLRSLDIALAEAALIERALAMTGNNRTRAADLLGISVRTLRNKLNRDPAADE